MSKTIKNLIDLPDFSNAKQAYIKQTPTPKNELDTRYKKNGIKR